MVRSREPLPRLVVAWLAAPKHGDADRGDLDGRDDR